MRRDRACSVCISNVEARGSMAWPVAGDSRRARDIGAAVQREEGQDTRGRHVCHMR